MVMDFRKRRKENLIKVCGSSCNLCGYNKCNSALEFHHINPEEKSYGISSNGNCHNLEQDLNEISKCILVCANCHREIHDGLYSKNELIKRQIFKQDVVDKLLQDKEKKIYYCSNCNAEITKNQSGLCYDCFLKLRWKERKYPNREELKILIRTTPFTQIGRQYGITDNAVKKWCKKYDLPFRKSDILQFSDEEWSKV